MSFLNFSEVTFQELEIAYCFCLSNKKNTKSAIMFGINKERELIRLMEEINSFSYKPGKSIYFVVTKPKYREVFAADFRDRVVHHLLIRRFEEKVYQTLTEHPYSCLLGRGTHKGVQKIKEHFLSVPNGYYLQIDIKSFFPSIDKKILEDIVIQYIDPKDKISLYLTKTIINHQPTKDCEYRGDIKLKKKILPHKSLFSVPKGKGMAIGNYTSQFFANLYLHSLDIAISQDLGIKKYVRYVDDLVLVDNSKEKLVEAEEFIESFLKNNLKQTLAKEKSKLKLITNGIDFLGYFVKPKYSFIRHRIKKYFIEKLILIKKELIKTFFVYKKNLLEKNFEKNVETRGFYKKVFLKEKNFDFDENKLYFKVIDFLSGQCYLRGMVASYLGHCQLANSRHFLKQIFYSFPFLQYYFGNSRLMDFQLKLFKKNAYLGIGDGFFLQKDERNLFSLSFSYQDIINYGEKWRKRKKRKKTSIFEIFPNYLNFLKMKGKHYLKVKKHFSTVYEQYNWFEVSLPNCVIFFPIGSFYEAYDFQAVFLSEVFSFKLRNHYQKLNIGFPIHKKEYYTLKLLEMGYSVAIICSDQEEKKSGKVQLRFLEKIITPIKNFQWDPIKGGKPIKISQENYLKKLEDFGLLETQNFGCVLMDV